MKVRQVAGKNAPVDHDPSQDRSRRIVETVIALAEEGGFEAVKLRDVAADAGVALGTLYRRFRSKEDLLVAALEFEVGNLARQIRERPPIGATPHIRVMEFFKTATNGMLRRPNLARAMVKAVASGDPDLTKRVASFHGGVEILIIGALRGPGFPSGPNGTDEDFEAGLAYNLNLFWFALMVGWSGGLHSKVFVIERMDSVAAMVLRATREELGG
jgi:AcrR family transcriptional regulator